METNKDCGCASREVHRAVLTNVGDLGLRAAASVEDGDGGSVRLTLTLDLVGASLVRPVVRRTVGREDEPGAPSGGSGGGSTAPTDCSKVDCSDVVWDVYAAAQEIARLSREQEAARRADDLASFAAAGAALPGAVAALIDGISLWRRCCDPAAPIEPVPSEPGP